ncbi:GL15708 [Drosophila persimilis]|uniref:GL15708 n=1 Tax=Drosophila persimilis TaxID=7234 RepID=B4H8X6_DROPE|nr:GL15708 [Drosophila persimilis]
MEMEMEMGAKRMLDDGVHVNVRLPAAVSFRPAGPAGPVPVLSTTSLYSAVQSSSPATQWTATWLVSVTANNGRKCLD